MPELTHPGTSVIKARPKDYERLRAEAQGMIVQTSDRTACQNATICVDGTVYFTGVVLEAGMVITNLHLYVTTQGTNTDLSKVGIYSVSGATATRVAVSADLGNSWDSSDTKTHALSAAYTVPTTGFYYFALVNSTNGGNLTIFLRNAGFGGYARIGSGAFPYGTTASQTDLATPLTVTATSPFAHWWGAS